MSANGAAFPCDDEDPLPMNATDADGDSEMHSPALAPTRASPEAAGADDGPVTPTRLTRPSLGTGADLSPPDSQSAARAKPREGSASLDSSVLNENGKRDAPSDAPSDAGPVHASSKLDAAAIELDAATIELAAQDWTTKRAEDEYARAVDRILDHHLMVKNRYGDPLEPSVPRGWTRDSSRV